MTLLSKTTYLMGLQCPKLLWHRYHAKELLEQPSPLAQAIFDQGHEVGTWAKRLFPDGIEIAPDVTDFDLVCAETQQHLGTRQPLFEPAFRAAVEKCGRWRSKSETPSGVTCLEAGERRFALF